MSSNDDTPILAISRLQEIFEDDTAGIADLLDGAMRTATDWEAALGNALAHRAFDDVLWGAHAIMGSAANIGGNEVAAIAGRIESAARAKNWAGVELAINDLSQAYERLRTSVRAYRASLA